MIDSPGLSYKDWICCDVVPINMGHIILGQPWIRERKVTFDGHSNSCAMIYNSQKIKIVSLTPKFVVPTMGKEAEIVTTLIPAINTAIEKNEIPDDDIEESSVSVPSEVTPVNTEFHDVSPKDNTPNSLKVTPITTESTVVSPENNTLFTPEVTSVTIDSSDVPSEDNTLNTTEVTPVITDIVDALDEDLTDTLPPTREIQPAIELVPRVSLPDLSIEVVPHHEPYKVSTTPEVKQQCITMTYVHSYKDPFWNYVITKDVVMRESSSQQVTQFFSITVKPRGAFHLFLPVRISLVLIIEITGKLPYTLRMRHLIIPFDRGRKNY